MSKETQRKLAAVVSADVVGYSRLMGADEAGTLQRLNAHRSELIDKLVEKHGGRIVKAMGDGLLLEFSSVVVAVECCIAVQEGMAERNTGAGDEAIRYRIGVHLGDVIVEGDDIFGDGINIAARLQEIGEAGGVVISSNAHDSVDGRIDAAFVDGGNHELKNIARPVRVWRWSIEGGPAIGPSGDDPLPLADKPSIAVLPFDNMSGSPEQEYFSDGIAEDIITDLSKFSWLMVIARSSSFSYKGQAIDIRTVSKELSARYVLEGSVRKSGNRVRITAQLIDCSDGSHIWADRYDRELKDIFDLQDEMTQSITAAIAPELEIAEIRRAQRKRADNLDAWDYVMQARSAAGTLSEEKMAEVRRLAERALALQPGNAEALGLAVLSFATNALMGWDGSPADNAEKAIRITREALSEKSNDTFALYPRGIAEIASGLHDEAVETLRQCVALNPNDSLGHRGLAIALVFRGDYEEAVSAATQALKLSPRDVYLPFTLSVMGFAHYASGNAQEAVNWNDKVLREFPEHGSAYRLHAAVSVELGQIEEAKFAMVRFLEKEPQATIRSTLENSSYRDRRFVERFAKALRQAGMPEE
jgi:adenylate cyclase